MTLPASGALAFSLLQTEYGGANPISVSEYYRNGLYVPNSISVPTYYEGWTYPSYITLPVYGNVADDSISGSYYRRPVAGGLWVEFYGEPEGPLTEPTSPAIGDKWYVITRFSTFGSSATYEYAYMGRQERTWSNLVSYTDTPVNQSVPTSGTVSISNYYNGTN